MLTKGRALPSIMGISKESSSITALSTPIPLKAERICSTVETVTPLTPSEVANVVSDTVLKSADIGKAWGKSLRINTIPVSVSAGFIFILTLRPVCKPTLQQFISFFNVRCKCIHYLINFNMKFLEQ